MSSRVWRRQVEDLAAEYGCAVEDSRGDHLRITHPSGWSLSVSRTPSDHRALANVRSDLRRKAAGIWR